MYRVIKYLFSGVFMWFLAYQGSLAIAATTSDYPVVICSQKKSFSKVTTTLHACKNIECTSSKRYKNHKLCENRPYEKGEWGLAKHNIYPLCAEALIAAGNHQPKHCDLDID